jgi:lysophospholipase L1-like esterase
LSKANLPSSVAITTADHQNWLYLPSGWNTGWKTVKAAGNGLISVIGDSIAAGQGSTDWENLSWPGVLRDTLVSQGKISLGGEYWPSEAFAYSAYSPGTTPYGTGISVGSRQEQGFQRAMPISSGGSLPFTCPQNTVALDIIWVDNVIGGSWAYSVDGGTAMTVSMNNTHTIKKTSITGLSAAKHTLTINPSSPFILCGIVAYEQTPGSGVVISRHAAPGIAICDMSDPATATVGGYAGGYPTDKLGAHGLQTGVDASMVGAPAVPDLAIIELGINDNDYGYAPQAYRMAFIKLIKALRRGKPNCSIMLLAVNCPTDWYSEITYATALGQRYPVIKRELWDVGRLYNCAVLDVDAKWGEVGYDLGFQPSNNLHPNNAGHADIATTIAGVL